MKPGRLQKNIPGVIYKVYYLLASVATASLPACGPLTGNKLCLRFDIGKLAHGQPAWRLLSTPAIPINRDGSEKLLREQANCTFAYRIYLVVVYVVVNVPSVPAPVVPVMLLVPVKLNVPEMVVLVSEVMVMVPAVEA